MAVSVKPSQVRRWTGLLLALPLMLVAAATSAADLWPDIVSFRRIELPPDSGAVFDIDQDSEGYMWFATPGGLFRYDGYGLRRFRASDPGPGALPDDRLRELHVDRDGRLWLGSNDGSLAVYDSGTESFRVVGEVGRRPGQVNDIVDLPDGTMLVARGRAIERLDPATLSITPVPVRTDNNEADAEVFSLLALADGRILAGTRTGLMMRGPRDTAFQPVKVEGGIESVLEGSIWLIREDREGRIWVGADRRGVAVLEPSLARGRLLTPRDPGRIRFLEGTPRDVMEVQPGIFWISTFGAGLIQVEAGRWTYRSLGYDLHDPSALPTEILRDMHVDRSGLVWIASEEGVAIYEPPLRGVREVSTRRADPLALQVRTVRSLLQDRAGNLWIGGTGRLEAWSPEGERIAVIEKDPNGGGLPVGGIGSLVEGQDGSLYIGTQAGLFRRFPDGTVRVAALSDGLAGTPVSSVMAAGDAIYIGARTGLFRYDPVRGTTRPVPLRDAAGAPVSARITALLADGRGTIWAGSDDGLFVVNPVAGTSRHAQASAADPQALPHDAVTGLAFDRRGRLWVATRSGGLARLDGTDDADRLRFTRLGAAQGLGGDLVLSMVAAPDGRLWVRHDTAVSIVEPESLDVRVLSRGDGLTDTASNERTAVILSDGTYLAGGRRTLLFVDGARLGAWEFVPPLVATRVAVDDRLQRPDGRITLPPGARGLEVEYAALDFSDPGQVRYAHRLVGFDADWLERPASNRRAAYTNLAPGDYTLQVRATNRSGAWTEPVVIATVQVLPAWHQTHWFLAMLILGGLGLVGGIVQLRTAVLRRRSQALEKEVAARTADLVAANATLRRVGSVGQEITARLDPDLVVDLLAERLDLLLPRDAVLVYRLDEAEGMLLPVYASLDRRPVPLPPVALEDPIDPVAAVVRERSLAILDWPAGAAPPAGLPPLGSGILGALVAGETVVGALGVMSRARGTYGEREELVFRALIGYAAVALANAAAYVGAEKARMQAQLAQAETAEALDALRTAQARLVQQEKLASLGRLVAGVAHELNTPLGVALTSASMLLREQAEVAAAVEEKRITRTGLSEFLNGLAETVPLIERNVARAADLVKRFKELAVDRQEEPLQTVRLDEELRQFVGFMRQREDMRRVATDLTVPEGLTARLRPKVLEDVLLRLFENAVAHAFTGIEAPRIALDVGVRPDGRIRIAVSDNGVGMEPSVAERAFDPFFTTSRHSGGVGLGLHVVHNLVSGGLGGDIHLDTAPGRGTTVEILVAAEDVPERALGTPVPSSLVQA